MDTNTSSSGGLSTRQKDTWRKLMRMTFHLRQSLDRDLSVAKLNIDDYEILSNLSHAEGRRMRMSELATCSLMSASRLTYRMDSLVKDGFVERERCETDKRGFYAVLSRRGVERLAELEPVHDRHLLNRLFHVLSPHEQELLAQISTKLVAGHECDAAFGS